MDRTASSSPSKESNALRKLRGNPWAVLLVLCLGFFMILLDTTIVNIAIPSIIDGLSASLDQILWVLNAYILVYAVLLITSGRLGDLYGQRTLFLAGMAIFTVASAFCGIAQDPVQLIIARSVQGIGGALLTPQTLSIITTIFPPERRGAAFGVWGAVAGIAAVTGPTLGGFIVTRFDWQWIFYVNLPIGVVAFTLCLLIVPDIRPGRRHRLDVPGVLLATGGLFGITFGLIEGQRYHWGEVWSFVSIPLIIGAGLVLLAAFLALQYFERDEPLLPFAIFEDRNYSLMNWVGAVMSFGMLGLFLPITIYFQSVLGLSALQAGLTIAPMSLVSMIMAPMTGRAADRVGGKYILMAGLALFAAGMGFIAWNAQVNAARWSFLPGLIVAGLGMGCTFAPLSTLAMRNVQPHMAGAASGVLNTTRQLGGVVGSAAVGALLENRLANSLHEQAVNYSPHLPPQFRQRFIEGFSHTASNGLSVGRGQTGGSVPLPASVPAEVAHHIRQIAQAVFTHGFVHAMRPTLVLPVAILLLGSLSCLAIRSKRSEEHREMMEGAAQRA